MSGRKLRGVVEAARVRHPARSAAEAFARATGRALRDVEGDQDLHPALAVHHRAVLPSRFVWRPGLDGLIAEQHNFDLTEQRKRVRASGVSVAPLDQRQTFTLVKRFPLDTFPEPPGGSGGWSSCDVAEIVAPGATGRSLGRPGSKRTRDWRREFCSM